MARILVADDDLEQITLRKALLETGGHQVEVALSPIGTAHFLEHAAIDLVLMDLRFQNDSGVPDAQEGLALIRRIRELGFESPVVVLSGWPEELYGRPEEEMVSRVLIKPISMAVLLQTVAELVA